MKIHTLILRQYKRLMLSHIESFEYTPTSTLQLILGSNGSGKSSILSELTPLPGNHKDFAKDGEKIVVCEHRGHDYELKSFYDSGTGKHWFIRDGTNLNDGMTAAVQKQLVEEHFGLTREVADMLLGITTFTKLTTAKRREWLTRLSPTDMTYAFEIYHRIKGLHRDQQGVIKHLNKRMAQENHDLPDDNTRAQCRERIEQLTQRLNQLFEVRDNHQYHRISQAQLEQQLQHCLQRGRKLLCRPPRVQGQYWSQEDFNTQQRATQDELGRNREMLDHLQQSYHKLLHDQPSLDAEGLTPEAIDNLKQQRDYEAKQVSQLEAQYAIIQLPCFPVFSLPVDRQPQESLDQLYQEFMALLGAIPDNETGYYSREAGQRTQERLKELTRQFDELTLTRSTLSQRIARLKGCEQVHCPACRHAFIPGVDPQEIPGLQQRLGGIVETLTQLETQMTVSKTYMEAFQSYYNYVRQFRELAQHNPLFQPLWDYCVEHRVFFRTPRKYHLDFQRWYDAMTLQVRMDQAQQQLSVTQHKLRYVEAIDKDALTRADRERQALEADIQSRTRDQRRLQSTQERLTQDARAIERHQRELEGLCDELNTLLLTVEEEVAGLFQDAVSKETQQAQLSLAHTNEELSRNEVRAGVLNELNTQQQRAQREQQDYDILQKALSPTEGIIGQYLKTFMESVVDMLNAIIDRVWTYSMKVLPSRVEKEELDYRFPLDIREGSVTPPDIAFGSSGQQDMIDFAFRLLVMKFQDMQDYPVYLDELGSYFDEQHRINLIDFIDNMAEQGHIQQFFFISQYASTHGAFNQAEVCVLDASNITVPKHHNGHVVIA